MNAQPSSPHPRTVARLERHGRFWGIVGGITTVVGGIWLVYRFAFLYGALPAHGVVERVEQRTDSSVWYARFTFSDVEGRRHTAEMSFLSPTLCPSITVGNSVPVRYSRNNPADALIVTAATLWLYPVVVMAGGLFALVVGRLLRLVSRMIEAGKFRRAGQA